MINFWIVYKILILLIIEFFFWKISFFLEISIHYNLMISVDEIYNFKVNWTNLSVF